MARVVAPLQHGDVLVSLLLYIIGMHDFYVARYRIVNHDSLLKCQNKWANSSKWAQLSWSLIVPQKYRSSLLTLHPFIKN